MLAVGPPCSSLHRDCCRVWLAPVAAHWCWQSGCGWLVLHCSHTDRELVMLCCVYARAAGRIQCRSLLFVRCKQCSASARSIYHHCRCGRGSTRETLVLQGASHLAGSQQLLSARHLKAWCTQHNNTIVHTPSCCHGSPSGGDLVCATRWLRCGRSLLV